MATQATPATAQPHPPVSEHKCSCALKAGHILIALGVIALIGSLAATGYFYFCSSMGYPSFGIAGGGLLVAIALWVVGGFCLRAPDEAAPPAPSNTQNVTISEPQPPPTQDAKPPEAPKPQEIPQTHAPEAPKPEAAPVPKAQVPEIPKPQEPPVPETKVPEPKKALFPNTQDGRKKVFEGTLSACKQGFYIHRENKIPINNQPMLDGTITFGKDLVQPLDSALAGRYTTHFSVENDDTLKILVRLAREGHKPVGINMANRNLPGGRVVEGNHTQEEQICRCSNHYLGLISQTYPHPEQGGIYCPHVQVFRNPDWTFMDEPVEVALVAVAFPDLRSKAHRKEYFPRPYGIKDDETITEARLRGIPEYMADVRAKIRNMLRMMASKGHTHIVLGAQGCGAFLNPTKLVASLFQEAFQEPEFLGVFDTVIFGIYDDSDSMLSPFRNMCAQLNPKTN